MSLHLSNVTCRGSLLLAFLLTHECTILPPILQWHARAICNLHMPLDYSVHYTRDVIHFFISQPIRLVIENAEYINYGCNLYVPNNLTRTRRPFPNLRSQKIHSHLQTLIVLSFVLFLLFFLFCSTYSCYM